MYNSPSKRNSLSLSVQILWEKSTEIKIKDAKDLFGKMPMSDAEEARVGIESLQVAIQV